MSCQIGSQMDHNTCFSLRTSVKTSVPPANNRHEFNSGGCPVHGDTQCQTGWGSEHSDRAVGFPVHCRKLGWMAFKDPFSLKRFYDNAFSGF